MMVATIKTADFLGRGLTNESPGSSDATDYLGCDVVESSAFPPVPGDEMDRLGRPLTGGPG